MIYGYTWYILVLSSTVYYSDPTLGPYPTGMSRGAYKAMTLEPVETHITAG